MLLDHHLQSIVMNLSLTRLSVHILMFIKDYYRTHKFLPNCRASKESVHLINRFMHQRVYKITIRSLTDWEKSSPAKLSIFACWGSSLIKTNELEIDIFKNAEFGL